MNQFFIAAATVAALCAAAPALADGATYEYPQAAVSGLTRAEVRAELVRAIAHGEVVSGELSHVAQTQGPALTRADVRMALVQARANGELDLGERSFVPAPTGTVSMHVAGR